MTVQAKRRLGLVCARGGSKGVPGKNLWRLNGEPLVARAVRQAKESGVFDAVAVSSDDEAILEAGRQAGATDFVARPAQLASDSAGKLDVIRHAVEVVEESRGIRFTVVVDLDVTTPLRVPEDIRDVVHRLESSDPPLDAVLTASEARRSPWFNLVSVDADGVPSLPCGDGSLLRRQDSPVSFDLSGAVYAWQRDSLDEPGGLLGPRTRLYVLPPERAWDVDAPMDLLVVQALAQTQETHQ